MPTCDHTDPLCIPEWLCRRCHPELVMTPARKAALEAAEAERVRAERAERARRRELERAKAKLAALTKRGEPEDGSVAAKIVAALRKKIARLGG